MQMHFCSKGKNYLHESWQEAFRFWERKGLYLKQFIILIIIDLKNTIMFKKKGTGRCISMQIQLCPKGKNYLCRQLAGGFWIQAKNRDG